MNNKAIAFHSGSSFSSLLAQRQATSSKIVKNYLLLAATCSSVPQNVCLCVHHNHENSKITLLVWNGEYFGFDLVWFGLVFIWSV